MFSGFSKETGEFREIDCGFRMAGAPQNAPFFRFEREEMAGPNERSGHALGIGERANRERFFLRGNAGARVFMIDGHGERRLKGRGIILDHLREFETLARFGQERDARLTATVL